MIKPGLLLQNRYLVNRLLGRGGFGEVWEVKDGGTRKILKVLHNNNEKAIELFQQEAEVLKKLNHPGIPKVEEDGYFTFQPKGHNQPLHCLVMEFIEGQDLKQWLKQQSQPITQEQALEWLRQLAEILELVHARKYFHRDIKPSNIMRKDDGQLVLIDFGTARELTETYAPRVERGGVTKIQSLGYTAPEQLEGRAVPESDIFALGRTFVNLLTGKNISDLPEDPKTSKLLWRESAPQVSKPLADLIDELMEPLPDKRPKAQDILLQLSMLSIKCSVDPILSTLPRPIQFLAERFLESKFQHWFEQIRTPKIALYGRAGCGKSSLINAIMGREVAEVNDYTIGTKENCAYTDKRKGWEIQLIDSRGVGDVEGPIAFRQAIDYIVNQKVDILLFVIPVAQRDVHGDFEFLKALKAAHKTKHNAELPVILVLNKIDCVPPMGDWTPEYNLSLDTTPDRSKTRQHQAKEIKIRQCIKARIEEYQTLIDRYVPVCALWNELEDRRYNVDLLVQSIYNDIRDEAAKYGFGGATADKRLKGAISSRLTLVIAWFTFFLVSCSPKLEPNNISLLQQRLVSTIAQLAGNKEDQTIPAQKLLKKLRVENNYAIGALTSTFSVGKAAIDYFIERQEINLVQNAFTQEQKRLKPEFQEAFNEAGGRIGFITQLKKRDTELQERYGLQPICQEDHSKSTMPVVLPQF